MYTKKRVEILNILAGNERQEWGIGHPSVSKSEEDSVLKI